MNYTVTPLYKHQRDGLDKASRAIKHTGGVLIADEMGLGKTLLAMHCFCKKMYEQIQNGQSCKILILAPLSVLIEWTSQLHKHLNPDLFPSSKCQILHYSMTHDKMLTPPKRRARLPDLFAGGSSTSFIVLASYGTMRNDAATLLSHKWDYAVMDECHYIKNDQSHTHQRLCRYLLPSTCRIGLSGTPNANCPVKDLCALSQILFPTLVELHSAEHYASAKPSVLDSVIVRRTLKDVGIKLPTLTINTIEMHFVPQSPEWKAYDDQHKKTMSAMASYIAASKHQLPNRLQMLRLYQCAIHMLGKICTHYQISGVRSGGVHPLETATSAKEQYVHRVVADYALLQRKKLIVASTSSTFLQIVHAKVESIYPGTSVCFTGDTLPTARACVLDDWRHPDGPNVLLLSMKAGGVGLTLVEAHRMICVDGLSQSNPADREQVIKRVHRFGQKHTVMIDDLCMMGTIDQAMKDAVHPSKQRVTNILLRKRPVFEPLISASALSTSSLKTSVRDLCAIGKVLNPMWQIENGDNSCDRRSGKVVFGNNTRATTTRTTGHAPPNTYTHTNTLKRKYDTIATVAKKVRTPPAVSGCRHNLPHDTHTNTLKRKYDTIATVAKKVRTPPAVSGCRLTGQPLPTPTPTPTTASKKPYYRIKKKRKRNISERV